MELGFSGEAFGHLVLLMVFIALVVIALVFIIAKRRGVDVTSNRFQLKVGIYCLIIFFIIPLFFTSLPLVPKIIISILALAGGLANFFAMDRIGKILKDRFKKK